MLYARGVVNTKESFRPRQGGQKVLSLKTMCKSQGKGGRHCARQEDNRERHGGEKEHGGSGNNMQHDGPQQREARGEARRLVRVRA